MQKQTLWYNRSSVQKSFLTFFILEGAYPHYLLKKKYIGIKFWRPCIPEMEKEMATHSSTLAWEIPWMEEPGRLQSMGLQSQTRLSDFTFTFHFHALEKEMATHSSVLAWRIPGDGKAWWAAICGVAQSRTRLKRLSSSSRRVLVVACGI